MKSIIKFFLYIGLISLILYTTGCLNRSEPEEDATTSEPITLERAASPSEVDETIPTIADYVDKTTVVLYFADDNGRLVAEQREIPQVEGIARETMHELIRGPENEQLYATIPVGTRLMDIDISDDLCTLDFSKELITEHSGGSGSEYLTVYSIVNTLTQFGTVKEVQIRVEGQKVDTIAGHLDVMAPLERDDDIISTMELPTQK